MALLGQPLFTPKITFVFCSEINDGSTCGSRSRSSGDSYEIKVSHNDELFIINGEKYEAKTYCFNMEVGDQVIFIDGSAVGACASATIVNLRTKNKCDLWCE